MPNFRINTRYEDSNGDILWHGGKTVKGKSMTLAKVVNIVSAEAPRMFELPPRTERVVFSVEEQK